MSASRDIQDSPASLNDARHKEKEPTESQASPNQPSRDGTKTGAFHSQPSPQNQWPARFQWIKDNFTSSGLKPVIRCAISAWISVILFVIPTVEKTLGQASFLLLIASVLSPPAEPFLAVLEREILILLFVTVSWAWMCLGIFLASLARSQIITNINISDAISSAKYMEAAPSVIFGVWALGSAAFLYVKARQGPGPYMFATVFACILIDISVTTAPLIPFPYYSIGQAVVVPLTVHTGIALLCSILIFPATISSLFTARLGGVVSPLITVVHKHSEILQLKPSDESLNNQAKAIALLVGKAEAALTPLAMAARLLPADLIYCRFAPTDFTRFHDLARRLVVRANGMALYFSLIDPTRPRFPVTPAPSQPATPGWDTPTTSRPPSVIHEDPSNVGHDNGTPRSVESSPLTDTAPSLLHGHRHSHHHHHSHHHLLHLALTRKVEPAVGLFESQRYLNLESNRFFDPEAEWNTERSTILLQESCSDLLVHCESGLNHMNAWLPGVRHGRLLSLVGSKRIKKAQAEMLEKSRSVRDELAQSFAEFQQSKRLKILEMYRAALEGDAPNSPPHRHLFHCFVYQYHLLRFSSNVIDMLDEIIHLETERTTCRLWTPASRLFSWNNWQLGEGAEYDEDEDPDIVKGVDPSTLGDVGIPGRRDPDALPPRNIAEWALSKAYNAVRGLAHGNVLFAIKAAVLTVIMCLPSLIKSSAPFAYHNRFFWAIVMAQLTLARFRGDTIFGMVARIVATFLGGILGLVIWYIGSGSSDGNPYGLAAVFAVVLPFLFFTRLYFPSNPMTLIILLLTCVLVAGYSYQQKYIILPGNPGFGWNMAWRRFVLVAVGVVAAFIFSLLPPSTTIRSFQRKSLGTATADLGSIYCAIVSFANSHRARDTDNITASLTAIRSKLKRSAIMKENAVYEFSFRGRWPHKRYSEVLTLLVQISYSLSHLLSIVQQMEPAWTRAFLKRTRFSDPDFQGDVLAVFTMLSTALRTGTPLPQVTPSPLIDRFTFKYHGLNITTKDAEEDYGLPRELNMATLSNEQYLYFCVGVSTSYALMVRLDRLMLAIKEIVGEQYYIDGLALPWRPLTRDGMSSLRAQPSINLKLPKDV